MRPVTSGSSRIRWRVFCNLVVQVLAASAAFATTLLDLEKSSQSAASPPTPPATAPAQASQESTSTGASAPLAALLDPRQPPAGINVALAALGGKIVSATSENAADKWVATNLIDGGRAAWSSQNDEPQEIVLAFHGERQTAVTAVVIDTWTERSEMFSTNRYAYATNQPLPPKDVEVWVSPSAPADGLARAAALGAATPTESSAEKEASRSEIGEARAPEVDPQGFSLPSLDGFSSKGTQPTDASPEIEGKETTVEGLEAANGDRVLRLSTNGIVWGFGWLPGGDATKGYVLRDPTCSGTYTEKWAADAPFSAPECAVKKKSAGSAPIASAGGTVAHAVLSRWTAPLTSSPVGVTDTFPTQDEEINLVVSGGGAPRGTLVKAVWTAIDTAGAMPPNTKLDEMTSNLSGMGQWAAAIWPRKRRIPAGRYRVEVFVKNEHVQTLDFSIVEGKEVPAAPASGPIGACSATAVAERYPGFAMKVTMARRTQGPNREPADPGRIFPPDARELHAVVGIENAPRTKIRGSWIATDLGGAEACNTKLAEPFEMTASGSRNLDFTLRPPPGAKWPVGKYRVEIYANDALAMNLDFGVCDGECPFETPVAWTLP